ncbi:DUF1642 domain-containing protein [Enterococcus dispar]
MNKQEVIEILEKKRETALDNSEYYRNKENEKYEKMNRARVDSYTLAIQLVEQFEEPQDEKVEEQPKQYKPVVKPFVADWYEVNKEDLEGNIFTITIDIYDKGAQTEFEKWFNANDTKAVETLIKMKLFGYTAEQPKRWVVTTTDSDTCYLKRFRMGKECLDGDISKVWVGELGWAFTFNDKSKAEAVAVLVEGTVEEV